MSEYEKLAQALRDMAATNERLAATIREIRLMVFGVCIDCGEFLPTADGDHWK